MLNTPEKPLEPSPEMREAFKKILNIKWTVATRIVRKGGFQCHGKLAIIGHYLAKTFYDVCGIRFDSEDIVSIHFHADHIIIEII